jgi:hypothetical protein
VDLVWGEWPSNGAVVLLTSQVVFALHNTPDVVGVFMFVVAIFTAIVMVVGWWWEKQVFRTYYPPHTGIQHAL